MNHKADLILKLLSQANGDHCVKFNPRGKKKEGSNTNADFTLKKAKIQHLQSL